MTQPIDLSLLPAPNVIEPLDYESILQQRKIELVAAFPAAEQDTIAARLALESEPLIKLLEDNAYRELLLRQRVNEAAKSLLLAYAKDSDLDHVGVPFGVDRLELSPADPSTSPPTPAVYEQDEPFRRRIQLAPESYTSCGTFEAYRFAALSVAGVADAKVSRPVSGTVRVHILSDQNSGQASPELMATVFDHLNARDRRSVNDHVEVVSADIRRYAVRAALTMYSGPSSASVMQTVHAALDSYSQAVHKLGESATLSGIYAALHQAGVQRVELTAPTGDIICTDVQAPFLAEVDLSVEQADG